jgi:hypothetical protein
VAAHLGERGATQSSIETKDAAGATKFPHTARFPAASGAALADTQRAPSETEAADHAHRQADRRPVLIADTALRNRSQGQIKNAVDIAADLPLKAPPVFDQGNPPFGNRPAIT